MANGYRLKKGQVNPNNPHATSIAGPAKLNIADASKVEIQSSLKKNIPAHPSNGLKGTVHPSGFVPKESYDEEVAFVCTHCGDEYLNGVNYCDNTIECTGADLYNTVTGEYHEV